MATLRTLSTLVETLFEILTEHEKLQHMVEMKDKTDADEGFYIRHYGMPWPSNETTKCYVDFNASTKTSTRFQLNDLLCKGKTL